MLDKIKAKKRASVRGVAGPFKAVGRMGRAKWHPLGTVSDGDCATITDSDDELATAALGFRSAGAGTGDL